MNKTRWQQRLNGIRAYKIKVVNSIKKTKIISIALFGILFLGCFSNNSDESRMRKQLKTMKKAINNNNSDKFIGLLEDETKNYFKLISNATLNYSDEELNELYNKSQTPFLDLLYIFSARKIIEINNLTITDSNDFLKMFLSHGGFNYIKDISIEKIRNIHNNIGVTTTHQKINSGLILEGTLIFMREGENWKIDITSFNKKSNNLIKIFCSNNYDKNDYKLCLASYAKANGGIELSF